jgi:2-polyprenyl-3-methyl-5-hydroxy-6-metoxy-1,4-benzoquinol methylase
MTLSYLDKQAGYFNRARTDIAPLLPESFGRVLEFGCGAGATLKWLKQTGRCSHTTGVELFAPSALEASTHVDRVVTGNAETLIADLFPGEHFDLILCLDVLEHMLDPWNFVSQLPRLLTADGVVLFSVPNVRNFRVILPLLLAGRFNYVEEGVLDRTHLRFFTRKSALELASIAPFVVERWHHNIAPPPATSGLLNRLSMGLAADFLAVQYLIRSRLAPVR